MSKSPFLRWMESLVPVRTAAAEAEYLHDPGYVCEYTMPAVGDRVRGKENGRWFGEGCLSFTEEDGYCEVDVDRPLLGLLGQEPFTAITDTSCVWTVRPQMPLLPVMWRLRDRVSQEWAVSVPGRIAAAESGIRIIQTRLHGLLIGSDDLPPTWYEMVKRHLLPYYKAMQGREPARNRSLGRTQAGA